MAPPVWPNSGAGLAVDLLRHVRALTTQLALTHSLPGLPSILGTPPAQETPPRADSPPLDLKPSNSNLCEDHQLDNVRDSYSPCNGNVTDINNAYIAGNVCEKPYIR